MKNLQNLQGHDGPPQQFPSFTKQRWECFSNCCSLQFSFHFCFSLFSFFSFSVQGERGGKGGWEQWGGQAGQPAGREGSLPAEKKKSALCITKWFHPRGASSASFSNCLSQMFPPSKSTAGPVSQTFAPNCFSQLFLPSQPTAGPVSQTFTHNCSSQLLLPSQSKVTAPPQPTPPE